MLLEGEVVYLSMLDFSMAEEGIYLCRKTSKIKIMIHTRGFCDI